MGEITMITHFIKPSHIDVPHLSGLFFIIDGHLYIDSTTKSVKHNSHRKVYQTILESHPTIAEKYRLYPYLYFPRGFLLYQSDIQQLMLGCPSELSSLQRESLMMAFNHPRDRKYLYMVDDPHYNLDWLIERVSKVQTWPKEMIKDEISWFKSFYLDQIAQFITEGEKHGV